MVWIEITDVARAESLEPALEEALRGFAGSWKIEVTDGLVGGWRSLLFRRDDGVERMLLMSPFEQSADWIREAVQSAFRTAPPRPGSGTQTLPPGLERDRRAIPRL